MPRTKFLAITLTLLGTLAACSSEKEGPKAPPDPLATAEGFCAEWAAAACTDEVVRVCSASSKDACIASQAQFCASLVPENRYAKAHAKACIAAVKSAYSNAELTPEEAQTVLRLENECSRVVSGPGATGDPCDERSDCNTLDGLDCVREADVESGTCGVAQVQGGGFPCGEPNQVCAEGFYCDGSNCLARRTDGASCSPETPCLETLLCEGPEGAETCEPKLTVTSRCTADEQCASGLCARGTSAEGICVAQIVLSTAEPTCQTLR
jgi:hypothetical protein